MERLVVRTREKVKAGEPTSFVFTGKLIFDCNVPIGNHPSLQAVEDRLNVLPFSPSDEELAAVIRYLVSLTGKEKQQKYSYVRLTNDDQHLWGQTTIPQRKEVAEYVLTLDAASKCRHSLRRYKDVLKWLIQAKKRHYTTDWRDQAKKLIARDSDYENSEAPTQNQQRLHAEREELMILLEDWAEEPHPGVTKNDVISMWLEITGNKSSRQFRRRLDELPKKYS